MIQGCSRAQSTPAIIAEISNALIERLRSDKTTITIMGRSIIKRGSVLLPILAVCGVHDLYYCTFQVGCQENRELKA